MNKTFHLRDVHVEISEDITKLLEIKCYGKKSKNIDLILK